VFIAYDDLDDLVGLTVQFRYRSCPSHTGGLSAYTVVQVVNDGDHKLVRMTYGDDNRAASASYRVKDWDGGTDIRHVFLEDPFSILAYLTRKADKCCITTEGS